MKSIIVATRNRHKVGEIARILGDGFRFQSLLDYPSAPTVVEDASTFEGNAVKKAMELVRWLTGRLPEDRSAGIDYVIADDSGLEVDALGGAPGVRSARFAAEESGGNSPDAENNAKLLRLLGDLPPQKRTARFRCALAFAPVVGRTVSASPVCLMDESELRLQVFAGVCEGRIATAPTGAGGFGYDPLFVPAGFQESFAELGEDVKNAVSHRALALAKLRDWLGSELG